MLPSQLLQDAVDEFSKLPGIGRKTALRLTLHLLKQNKDKVEQFGEVFIKLINGVKSCSVCCNISETDICQICASKNRDTSTICIVESIKDVMAIERTSQYNGLYHVLGGVISPMEGIGPNDITIDKLAERLQQGSTKELIIALSATMEGDTTGFYIYKQVSPFDISVSNIARGIAVGDELEYADEITLGQSIANRQPFNH